MPHLIVLGKKLQMKFRKTARFRRSSKKMAKRDKSSEKLKTVIEYILKRNIPAKYKDHALQGGWIGHRECHIESDWLLIYRFEKEILVLVDMGSHANMFGK